MVYTGLEPHFKGGGGGDGDIEAKVVVAFGVPAGIVLALAGGLVPGLIVGGLCGVMTGANIYSGIKAIRRDRKRPPS